MKPTKTDLLREIEKVLLTGYALDEVRDGEVKMTVAYISDVVMPKISDVISLTLEAALEACGEERERPIGDDDREIHLALGWNSHRSQTIKKIKKLQND